MRGEVVIITIDGPAGSGKSTTARAVARRLGFQHLDSGAFYRAITLAALRAGIPTGEWPELDAARLDTLGVGARPAGRGFEMLLHDVPVPEEIRAPEVNANVSLMASVAAVRDWLFDRLRAAAANGSLVSDGRDMGTVVFPEADIKVYLTADLQTRARRRLAENGVADPSAAEISDEMDRIAERDRIDSSREISPLRPADDAILIDTSGLTFDEQVTRIVSLVRTLAGDRDTAEPRSG